MEPLSKLKRTSLDVESRQCLICQSKRKESICKGTPQGIDTLKQAAQERLNRKDPKQQDSIERILQCSDVELVWHRSCYSTFTSRRQIARLNDEIPSPSSSCHRQEEQTAKQLRSTTNNIDWGKCVFCQNAKTETLHSIQTFNTSDKIINMARYDHQLNISLAGVHDLIAAEGKYHLKCYRAFSRKASHIQDVVRESDLAMGWLCSELQNSASRGHILSLDEVWQYYANLCHETHEEIPNSFISRRSSFKTKVKGFVDNVYDFHVLEKSGGCDKGTVLVPKEFSHIAIATLLSEKSEDKNECKIPVYKPGDNMFLTLVHVALKLRSDILCHPAYKGFQVSKDAAKACIPDSLYMFLKVSFGGQSILENDNVNDNTDDNVLAACDDRIVSVAQDMVYGASKEKMWTPKHVGLGLTLHQVTRSKQLVQLFHKAGHTISPTIPDRRLHLRLRNCMAYIQDIRFTRRLAWQGGRWIHLPNVE